MTHGVHMTHCFQGDHSHTCAYGDDDDCPARVLEKPYSRKIEVEESALDSLKAMAQRLQQERDALLEALSISQEILESVDPYVGQEDILTETMVMNRELIDKCTAEVRP